MSKKQHQGPTVYHILAPGVLLDELTRRLGLSRRKAKDLLDRHRVFVNDRRIWMAHHRLKKGDRVEVHEEGIRKTTQAKTKAPPIQILYDDTACLVADKPPGLLSTGDLSVESLLREQLNLPSLSAVHRLDKDTSGCLLLAKTARVRETLTQQFAERKVTKLYHAIAWGRISDGLTHIQSQMDGQDAVTGLTVLSRTQKVSHVRAKIETGRTHQIRKHLRSVRHPIVGDRRYGLADIPEWARSVPRHMLHAHKLAFRSPAGNGRTTHVTSPLPKDFRRTLEQAGLT